MFRGGWGHPDPSRWEETEQNEERGASRFLLGAHLARHSGETADALILEEASLASLRRSRYSREAAAVWRITEQEGLEAQFRASAVGPSNLNVRTINFYYENGVFAYILALPILRKYDARVPEAYGSVPPAFDGPPGDR